jgi:hypothetical protein
MKPEITFKRPNYYNIHDASRDILALDRESEDYQFRMQAIIKRLIHFSKASVYNRLKIYHEEFLDDEFNAILKEKVELHSKMSKLPDEEIITWDMKGHTYKK